MAEGALERVEKFCRLVSGLVSVFSSWNDSTAFALIVFFAGETTFYIKQHFSTLFKYNHNILKRWQTSAEQYRRQETYDELLDAVQTLDNRLTGAVVDKNVSLPDLAGIQLLFRKLQAKIKYYCDIRYDLNKGIDEALATLESEKTRANPQYLNMWVFGSLVLLDCLYVLICHMTDWGLDWRWCILGVTAAAGIAYGLMLKSLRLEEISKDIEEFHKERTKCNKTYCEQQIEQLELSSWIAYPNVLLPNLRQRGGQVEDAGPRAFAVDN